MLGERIGRKTKKASQIVEWRVGSRLKKGIWKERIQLTTNGRQDQTQFGLNEQ